MNPVAATFRLVMAFIAAVTDAMDELRGIARMNFEAGKQWGQSANRGQMGIFMILVYGVIALVIVTVVALFGMDIAGEFADGIQVDNSYSDEADATVNSTGNAFQIFGSSTIVIPAVAVLAVLIGGLVGVAMQANGGASMGGRLGGR